MGVNQRTASPGSGGSRLSALLHLALGFIMTMIEVHSTLITFAGNTLPFPVFVILALIISLPPALFSFCICPFQMQLPVVISFPIAFSFFFCTVIRSIPTFADDLLRASQVIVLILLSFFAFRACFRDPPDAAVLGPHLHSVLMCPKKESLLGNEKDTTASVRLPQKIENDAGSVGTLCMLLQHSLISMNRSKLFISISLVVSKAAISASLDKEYVLVRSGSSTILPILSYVVNVIILYVNSLLERGMIPLSIMSFILFVMAVVRGSLVALLRHANHGSMRAHPDKCIQTMQERRGFILDLTGVLQCDEVIISEQDAGFVIGSVQIVVSTTACSRDVMCHAYQAFEDLVDDLTVVIDTRRAAY